MAIDFKQGSDYEEKRFLAGILIVHISELMKRHESDRMSHELKKAALSYSDSEFRASRENMDRYELLRRKGMKMIGAPEFRKLETEDYEIICDLLTRFDVIREVMES